MNKLNCLKVKATDLHYQYCTSMVDFVTDIASDGDEHPTWNNLSDDMDVLRRAVSGKAKVEELQEFFQDGNTMMALGNVAFADVDNYFHKEKGNPNDLILQITDDKDNTLYTISGKYLNY